MRSGLRISTAYWLQSAPAVFPPQRRWVTSPIDRLRSAVAAHVSSLVDTHLMPPSERHITEQRRPYPRRASMAENLAERLGAQRRLRAHVVPARIIVSKDRQYLDLVWSAAALVAIDRQQLGEKKAAGETREERTVDDGEMSVEQRSRKLGRGSAGGGDVSGKGSTDMQRSRFLAEFLRAYSPSTDVIGADALIYGCRGITIADVIPVGNYALRIVFSDGHSGGIYPYEYLFYLGCNKYAKMREYIRRLRAKRKPRDSPKRAPSRRFLREQRVLEETTQAGGSNNQA